MTAPSLSYKTATGKRQYRSPRCPGVVFDSVTSVLDAGIPKYGLNAARLRLSIEYAMDHRAEWERLPDREDQVRQIRAASERAWGPKARRGTQVHGAIEKMIKGEEPDAWDAMLGPWLEAFKRFRKDFAPHFGITELTVFNETERYAGTLDFWMTSEAMPHLGLCLGDWKTGAHLQPDAALQLAAYAKADYGVIGLGENVGEIVDIPKFDRGLLIHLREDASYSAVPADIGRDTYAEFLGALAVARYETIGQKNKLGEALDPKLAAHEWDIPVLVRRIGDMTPEIKLALQSLFIAQGLPTRPAQWSTVDVERVLAMVRAIDPVTA